MIALSGNLCRADAKYTFSSISSIQIFSLQPNALADLNVLTDVSRQILADHGDQDPLEYGSKWGMIQNRDVKVCNDRWLLKPRNIMGLKPTSSSAAKRRTASSGNNSIDNTSRTSSNESGSEGRTPSSPQASSSTTTLASK